MKMSFKCVQILILVVSFSWAAEEEKTRLNAGAFVEFGAIMKGENLDNPQKSKLSNQFVERSAFYWGLQKNISQQTSVNLNIAVILFRTVAGAKESESFGRYQITGSGLSTASFSHQFSPFFRTPNTLELEVGLFNYKYTSSKNLGEYLLRTNAYPTILRTGGLVIVNSAHYRSLALKLSWNWFNGLIKNDLLLTSSYDYIPVYDISPTWIFSLNLNSGIQIGGGISFQSLFAADDDLTNPKFDAKTGENANINFVANLSAPLDQRKKSVTFIVTGDIGQKDTVTTDYIFKGLYDEGALKNTIKMFNSSFNTGDTLIRVGPEETVPLFVTGKYSGAINEIKLKSICELGLEVDKNTGCQNVYQVDTNGVETVTFLNDNGVFEQKLLHYDERYNLTFQATKVVSFFHIDVAYLLGWSSHKDYTFNLYGEIALLGVQNYPGSYDNRIERTPMLLGFDIPTLGFLDKISFEAEYLRNRKVNSEEEIIKGVPLFVNKTEKTSKVKRNDWKWTFFAEKHLNKTWKIFLQVSNDHLRLPEEKITQTFIPVTNTLKHWYWLMHVQWAI